jgi:hypothetical protein
MTAWARVALDDHRGGQIAVPGVEGSRLRIWSSYPAGEWPVPTVVWWLEEHCLPELVVAAVTRAPDVSHAAAAPGRLPR